MILVQSRIVPFQTFPFSAALERSPAWSYIRHYLRVRIRPENESKNHGQRSDRILTDLWFQHQRNFDRPKVEFLIDQDSKVGRSQLA